MPRRPRPRLGPRPPRPVGRRRLSCCDGARGRSRSPGGGAGGRAVETVGAVPERAPVGHRPRGLQRQRRRLELLHPRPGAVAGLQVGRGRHRRPLRRPPAAVLRRSPLWNGRRPDPQGADVRPDQRRGQPRRGRQGVLLLPRRHADELVPEVPLPVPAGGVTRTTTSWRRTARAADSTSSTSCSTPASSTTTATSTSTSSTPSARPTTSLVRITLANRSADAATVHLLPSLWFRNTWWMGRAKGDAARRRTAPAR